MKYLLAMIMSLVMIMGCGVSSASAGTLDEVRGRDVLRCGVTLGLQGFSSPDGNGNWSGLDADFCRAVASSIFGNPSKVKFVPLSATNAFAALQSGEVDVLAHVATWTMSRDTQMGLAFSVVNFYDGQGFMVRRSLNISSASQLSGASVCMNTGTTTELNVADYFRAHNMQYHIVPFQKPDEAVAAYESGRCDAYTSDKSALVAERLKMRNPGANIVLPETISQEPLGPVVRQGDWQWFNIVRWTHYAMLQAELDGVSQKNVDSMLNSDNPKIRRLLGVDGDFGRALGLDRRWAYSIVRNVGNYGETFDRDLGKDSPLKIDRGLNRLWTEGGLQYGMPIL
jgi:general L-amino acid transport system substrate-binding protein